MTKWVSAKPDFVDFVDWGSEPVWGANQKISAKAGIF